MVVSAQSNEVGHSVIVTVSVDVMDFYCPFAATQGATVFVSIKYLRTDVSKFAWIEIPHTKSSMPNTCAEHPFDSGCVMPFSRHASRPALSRTELPSIFN